MRPALIATTLLPMVALAACGTSNGDAGAERGTAAGEVLGGEISDAMIPLDTVRSTSPVAPRASPAAGGAARTSDDQSAAVPEPEANGAPEPLPDDPGTEDAPAPPQQ